jgi:Tol biopolymer transport system component/C-terminal processing protease CtpA/Prc
LHPAALHSLRRYPSHICLIVCLASASFCVAQTAPLPSLAEPSLSPDGSEIAFASGGDIWTVPAAGGVARLLVTDPATESRPIYSPDGKQLAFVSTRTGAGDIYLLTLATGELKRLTWSDQPDQLDGWSRDGKWIYFTSAANDIAHLADIFRVSASGGTPLEVSRERYLAEFEGAPSPDGNSIALCAKGISFSQWWRNGHAHIDETEIWLKPIADSAKPKVLVEAHAKHAWPMWSPKGDTLYFMSDKSGAENLWSLTMGTAQPGQLTHFEHGRVLYPSISYDGKAIVFERNLTIWKFDIASGRAAQVSITLLGVPGSPAIRHTQENKFDDLALSPDGKKIAVTSHGEVFALPAKEGGEGVRLTRTPERESDLHWSPDSSRILYVSERDGHHNLFEYDFKTEMERSLTSGNEENEAPRYSPDGKMVAYIRNEQELRLIALANGTDRLLASDLLRSGTLEWSANSEWIAYSAEGVDGFTNLKVVAPAGGEAHWISFLANGFAASNIAWAPDGKYILFDTAQRSENVDMARVDLTPHVPKYREDELRDLFHAPGQPPAKTTPEEVKPKESELPDTAKDVGKNEKAEADKKKSEPIPIAFDGIRDRLTLLPLGLSTNGPLISPDGKLLVFTARSANHQNLYSYSLDENAKEPAVPKQLTSTAGSKSGYFFTPDSKELVFLEDGQPRRMTLESGQMKPIAASATLDIDFNQDKNTTFDEAWSVLNRRFYDADFHGRNWSQLRETFAPYIAGSRTPDEMRRDINLMIGELNSSHSGIRGPDARVVKTGRLGLRFDRERWETGKGLAVREVVPLGPAAVEGKIEPGDKLLAVDGRAIDAHTNLDELLEDQAGRRTVLRIAGKDGKERDAVVQPIDAAAEAGLLYRAWVESNRAAVEKLSGGKLGYVHIADMSDRSLKQLYIDLDAQNQAREGVVIDIRNNNGGYVNGYALDVFTRKNYMMMTPRGMPAEPSRQELGQRALGLPTILLTNESSLSDAEDFTEGYRSLHLGKVVGTPTAGWIIYTGGEELIDGSTVRTPQIRVQDLRGQTMEGHPRPVDIGVVRQPGETLEGRDSQLEKAVTELLGQLSAKP